KTILSQPAFAKKSLFSILVLILSLDPTPAQAGQINSLEQLPSSSELEVSLSQKVRVVLDLDETLVSRWPIVSPNSIDLGKWGKYYLMHGATEFIAALIQLP